MKKPVKIILLSVAGLSILLLLIFFRKRGFDSFVTPSEVNEITIHNDGGDFMTVTKQEDINQILNYMDNITYRRIFVPPWGGFDYCFSFYHNDQLLGDFVLAGSLADIGTKDYSYKNSNTITLEELVQSLPNSIFK